MITQSKYRFVRLCSVFSLCMLVSSRLSHAGEPAGDMAATRGTALSAESLQQVLDAASATQNLLKQASTTFRVIYSHNLERIPEQYKADHPNITHNGGVARGTIEWRRNSEKQWLKRTFDVPDEFKVQQYEPFLFVNDGDRQILHALRTRQTALMEPGELATLSPLDWLMPLSRGGFAQLREDPATSWEAFAQAEGEVLLRVTQTIAPDTQIVAEARLSPHLDHAVVEWLVPAWQQHMTIDYARNAEGLIFPTRAVMITYAPGTNSAIKSLTLETLSLVYGAPNPAELAFPFEPGMTFLDNRTELYGGKVKRFRVAADGSFEAAQSIDSAPAVRVSKRGTVGVGAVAILGLVLTLCFRAYIAQSKR